MHVDELPRHSSRVGSARQPCQTHLFFSLVVHTNDSFVWEKPSLECWSYHAVKFPAQPLDDPLFQP